MPLVTLYQDSSHTIREYQRFYLPSDVLTVTFARISYLDEIVVLNNLRIQQIGASTKIVQADKTYLRR
jgi:hypothetical protein